MGNTSASQSPPSEQKHNKSNSSIAGPPKKLKAEADSIQCVLPSIYMGSAVAAKNLQLLREYKITHILAIGWNLKVFFPDDFTYLLVNHVEDRPQYLILQHFDVCFKFFEQCFSGNSSSSNSATAPVAEKRLFVHCHKGLSRSATIIIGYEMWKHQRPFEEVLMTIQENRSFILPNIGFQAQLKKFEETHFSLNIESDDYAEFDPISHIQKILPRILNEIRNYYKYFQANEVHKIVERDLFAKTMYIHQAHKLQFKEEKLTKNDITVLNECIDYLRRIQEEFIRDEQSIHRFRVMFGLDKNANGNSASKTDTGNSK